MHNTQKEHGINKSWIEKFFINSNDLKNQNEPFSHSDTTVTKNYRKVKNFHVPKYQFILTFPNTLRFH